MSTSKARSAELVSLLRDAFPAARIECTGNEHETYWVEVWNGAGHAEVVFLAKGEIGGTDFRQELGPDDNPFAPYAEDLPSVEVAFTFMSRALV